MSLGVLNKAACVTSLFFKIRQLDWTTCNWSSRRFSVNNLWVEPIHLIYYYNSVFNKIISLLSILFLSNMLPKVPFFFSYPPLFFGWCVYNVCHLVNHSSFAHPKTTKNKEKQAKIIDSHKRGFLIFERFMKKKMVCNTQKLFNHNKH